MTESAERGPRRPVHARRLLEGFRDLGVPENREETLACEPSFNRYTAFWLLGETLDAGYAALEGMSLASPEAARKLIEEIRPRIIESLARHFDEESGRFATNSNDRTRGLFALHTALGIMRSLEGARLQTRLTSKRFRAVMDEIGPQAASTAQDAIDGLMETCRQGDGVVENPQKPLMPTINALYIASSILWHLDDSGNRRLNRFIEPHRLERFIFGCLKRERVDDGWISGFVIHPDHRELCVNTTFFGLQLMEQVGIDPEPACVQEIEAFLRLSYRNGGFSSTRWERSSLNATYFGLRALDLVASEASWKSFVDQHCLDIWSFLHICLDQASGGAPFTPDPDRYLDNCLATRYWLQIAARLRLDIPRAIRGRIFQFYRDRLDDETGTFTAYPQEAIERNGFGPDDLTALLDQKDEKLLRHHRAKLDDLDRPPAYFPDTKTMDFYDRLVELGRKKRINEGEPADVQNEIERIWRGLRSRQEAEAELFRAQFEREVFGPLRQDHAKLVELMDRLTSS